MPRPGIYAKVFVGAPPADKWPGFPEAPEEERSAAGAGPAEAKDGKLNAGAGAAGADDPKIEAGDPRREPAVEEGK